LDLIIKVEVQLLLEYKLYNYSETKLSLNLHTSTRVETLTLS